MSVFATLMGAAASTPRSEATQSEANLLTFDMDELVAKRALSERPYLPFLDLPSLRCGLYVLPAGGEDGQNPHQTDEVYYVLSGKAKIRVEDEVQAVSTGSVIYVKAHAEHRFIDIEEEIQLLVFFD